METNFTEQEVLEGHRVYTKTMLKVYDFLVYRINSSTRSVRRYRQESARQHSQAIVRADSAPAPGDCSVGFLIDVAFQCLRTDTQLLGRRGRIAIVQQRLFRQPALQLIDAFFPISGCCRK